MDSSQDQTARALVAYAPFSKGPWRLENVIPRPIANDEVLVRIVASGICLADVHFGDMVVEGSDMSQSFPRILGHEGRNTPKICWKRFHLSLSLTGAI